MSVCVSVCVSVSALQPKGRSKFDENPHKYALGCLPVPFFSDLENSDFVTSWWPFCIKLLGHSHICILTPIFFKF